MNRRRLVLLLLSALAISQSVVPRASAADLGDAQWIWSPNHNKYEAPAGALYFRKVFELTDPESGTVEITCDNSYELFLNGTSIGKGSAWAAIDKFDVGKQLKTGRNILAVAGTNESAGAAGMVARLTAKERGKKAVVVASDSSWKSSPTLIEGWQSLDFKDDKWEPARTFGKFGQHKGTLQPTARIQGRRGGDARQHRLTGGDGLYRAGGHPGFTRVGPATAGARRGPRRQVRIDRPL